MLSEDHSYSLQVIERLLRGMPGVPRIGFSFVDVRDVADLQIRAMTAPEAGGERFIATERFLWMAEVAAILRERLGEDAAKVPTRSVPNLAVRAMGIFDPSIRSITGQLGKKTELSSEKARARLGWSPRPSRGHDRRLRPQPQRKRGWSAIRNSLHTVNASIASSAAIAIR